MLIGWVLRLEILAAFLLTPKASKLIAGGNATGKWETMIPTLKGSKIMFDATLSGSEWGSCLYPVAMLPAIEFVAFGDIALLRSAPQGRGRDR